MRLGILVDAACDLPQAFIAQNPIRVMPIPVRVGGRELIDVRDDAETKDFFLRVLAAGATDVESRPYTEEELEKLFLPRLVLDFDYLVCVTIAAQRSPIFERAQKFSFQIITKYKPLRQAANVPGPFAMRVLDSGNLFAAQGVQVMELARLIRADTPVPRIVRRLDEIVPRTYCYIVPSDLRYLHARPGRQGEKGAGFFANAVEDFGIAFYFGEDLADGADFAEAAVFGGFDHEFDFLVEAEAVVLEEHLEAGAGEHGFGNAHERVA